MRQKAKSLLAFLAVFIGVMALFVIWPKNYGSEGKIHVQMTRTETNLSPVVGSNGQGMGISIQDTRETEIKSVEEVLKSRAILEAVAKKVGPDRILKSKFAGFLPSITVPSILRGNSASSDMSPEEYESLKELEKATERLQKSLNVHNVKKTSVISVYMKANSPRLAQEIVNEIIEEARSVHQKMHGVTGSSAFFSDKIEEAEVSLEQSMTDLESFREKNQLLSVGAARGTLQEIIGTLEKGIVDTGVLVEQSQMQITELKKTMAKTPETIVLRTKGVERKSSDDANTDFFRLKSRRTALLAQYNPNHPEVRKIESQMDQMRNSVKRLKDDRTESRTMPNEVFADVTIQLVRAEAENVGAKARLKSLKERLVKAQKQAIDMNRSEIEADRLQRKINDTRKDRDMYVNKGREALASLSLDNSNLSTCLLYTSPSPRDATLSRMPSSA